MLLLYAIQEAADAYEEKIVPLCERAGLTFAQFNLLYLVLEGSPKRLGALAKYGRCVKSNVTYLVQSMERAGLLVLEPDPDDRRARVVTATPQGKAAFRRVLRGGARLQQEATAKLGQKAAERLAAELMAVARVFDGL